MKHFFKIFFYVKWREPLSCGRLAIMCRLSANGKQCVFSTHLMVKEQHWNASTQKVMGRSREARQLNQLLNNIRFTLYETYLQVLKSHTECTPQAIRDSYLGENINDMGILSFFRKHNEEFGHMVGVTRSENTLNKYKYVLQHLERFIHETRGVCDIPIYKINREFVASFHRWLAESVGCGVNTIWIYMTALKRIIRLALGQGYISTSPFYGYNLHHENTHKNFLYKEELRSLMKCKPKSPTARLVLDGFLFSCFTGLSFTDLKQLTMQNITTRNGIPTLSIRRAKTHIAVEIPLLQLPQELIGRYCTTSEKPIFILPSNYHCNNLLREILHSVGIHRNITFHSARHTFATTVTLANGIPLEVVSAMLGHSNIKTTQIYAKVLQNTIQTAIYHASKRINSYYFPRLNLNNTHFSGRAIASF